MVKKSRNSEQLARGIARYGRGASYHRAGNWAVKNKVHGATKAGAAGADGAGATKTKKFGKGQRQVPVQKEPRYYPTDDVPAKRTRSFTPGTARLRQSIQPGQVLILLAGRHRGKRVVFLKQLSSGLLMVTGPFKINGVPLRRVNQAYVIATKTRVDLTGLKLDDEKLNDSFFGKPANAHKKKGEAEFFADEDKKHVVDDAKKAEQKKVDDVLLKNIAKVNNLKAYLGAKFSLGRGQFPHKMDF